MASLLVIGGLVALAAGLGSRTSEPRKPQPQSTQTRPLPRPSPQYMQEAVHVPEDSQGAHPGNLPMHQPIYAHPETDPERANAQLWNLPSEPVDTGCFLDAFQEMTSDTPQSIKNSNRPEGLLPHFREKDVGLRYIPAQEPYEFRPPKTELFHAELRAATNNRENNVHGNLDYATMLGKRYAQLNHRGSGPTGALDHYNMWEMPVGNCPTTQELQTGIAAEEVESCERGWFGAKVTTRQHEGEHPRVRIYPRKEGFMSLRQQVFSRGEHGYSGAEHSYNPSLGRYETPDNEDTTLYTREPLPGTHKGPGVPARIEHVPIRRTERATVQYGYTGAPGETSLYQEALRPSCINPHAKNMVTTHVMGAPNDPHQGGHAGRNAQDVVRTTLSETNTLAAARSEHGALGVDTIADVTASGSHGGGGRVNSNESRGTLKSFTNISAGSTGYWHQRNAEHTAMQYWPDHPGAEVRRVTPTIRQDIDPTLIQAYMSNPYTPPITNLPYPYATCGILPASQHTDAEQSSLPQYAIA